VISFKPNGLARVVECFEHCAGGLKVDPPCWLPLLNASLDVPTKSGVINVFNISPKVIR